MKQVSTETKKWKGEVTFEQTIEYNYEAMWAKLRKEMEYLLQWDVSTVHPTIVLGYMGFISQEERLRAVKGE